MIVLWVPQAGWHVPQRAHLFCERLARHTGVHATDWIADFAGPADLLSRRFVRTLVPSKRVVDGVVVHGVPRISPSLFSRRLRRVNAALLRRAAERIAREERANAVVGTGIAPPPRCSRLVFDLFDDNVAAWRFRHAEYAGELAEYEAEYFAAADVVVAASEPLAAHARRAGAASVVVIPNGVDLGRAAEADGTEFRTVFGRPGRPLVGSLGNFDDPAEVELLLDTGRELAADGADLLIAGRGMALAPARSTVRNENLTNVRFAGPVPLSRAPELAAALDIGLVPYRQTAMDEARSPMRLLLYASVGTPAVCTDVRAARDLGLENTLLAQPTGASFADAVRRALALPRAIPEAIARFDADLLSREYGEILRG